MKIKFNQDSINRIEQETKVKLDKFVRDQTLLKELGDRMIKDIQFTARRGVNPITGGKFIPLSPSWIKERGKIAAASPVDEAYKQTRSNITLSGQLLNSIKSSVLGKTVRIIFEGIHRPYRAKLSEMRRKNETTRQVGKPIPNDELRQYVNELRPFFFVRESLLPQLKSIVIRYIRRNL